MYEPMHPTTTFTVEEDAETETTPGRSRPDNPTAIGSYVGGFQDLVGGGNRVNVTLEGKVIEILGKSYADPSLDPGVKIGHVLKFTHPATGESMVLQCVSRRGPWDPTDDEDHFEIYMGSEQPGTR